MGGSWCWVRSFGGVVGCCFLIRLVCVLMRCGGVRGGGGCFGGCVRGVLRRLCVVGRGSCRCGRGSVRRRGGVSGGGMGGWSVFGLVVLRV